MVSVDAVPVAVSVCTVAQLLADMDAVASAFAPLAMVCVTRPVPTAAGNVKVVVPKAPVTGDNVTNPDVAFPNASVPSVPELPSVGVAVNVLLLNICPAAGAISVGALAPFIIITPVPDNRACVDAPVQ